MSQISPPIRILLVCAVAFMAAWMLFLRPKTDAGAPAASTPRTAAAAGRCRWRAGHEPGGEGGREGQRGDGRPGRARRGARGRRRRNRRRTRHDNATAATPTEDAAQPVEGTPAKLNKKESPRAACRCACSKRWATRRSSRCSSGTRRPPRTRPCARRSSGIDRHHKKVLAHATHIKRVAELPADHPRRGGRAVADRRGDRPQPPGHVARRLRRPADDRPGRHGRAAQLARK